jgi:hypothetical protein
MSDLDVIAARLAKVLYPDETALKANMDIVLETRRHVAKVLAADAGLRAMVVLIERFERTLFAWFRTDDEKERSDLVLLSLRAMIDDARAALALAAGRTT